VARIGEHNQRRLQVGGAAQLNELRKGVAHSPALLAFDSAGMTRPVPQDGNTSGPPKEVLLGGCCAGGPGVLSGLPWGALGCPVGLASAGAPWASSRGRRSATPRQGQGVEQGGA